MEEALAWRTTLFRKVFFESLFTGNLTAEVYISLPDTSLATQ